MKLKIKEYREEFGMTQSQLAARLNNMQRNISNWENGISEPDCATIVQIAKLFNISIDALFGVEEAPKEISLQTDRKLISLVFAMSEEQKMYLSKFLDTFIAE